MTIVSFLVSKSDGFTVHWEKFVFFPNYSPILKENGKISGKIQNVPMIFPSVVLQYR